MRKLRYATTVAALVCSAFGLLPGLASAESANETAVGNTISKLASKGYRVIVHRTGSASLDQCVVSRVRPGAAFSRPAPGAGGDNARIVTSKTVYLDVAC
ncbi:hypothetical protein ACRCUN_17610 [Mycobacterium sp. LTG2003]